MQKARHLSLFLVIDAMFMIILPDQKIPWQIPLGERDHLNHFPKFGAMKSY
jgi:hypothetical protein